MENKSEGKGHKARKALADASLPHLGDKNEWFRSASPSNCIPLVLKSHARGSQKTRRRDLMQKKRQLSTKFISAEFSWKLKSAFVLCLWLLHINILSVPGLMRFLGFLHTEFKDRIITMINKVGLDTAPAWNIQTLQDVLPIARADFSDFIG